MTTAEQTENCAAFLAYAQNDVDAAITALLRAKTHASRFSVQQFDATIAKLEAVRASLALIVP